MQGAAIGRAPTILQNDSFYTRISNFVKSPFLSATGEGPQKESLGGEGVFPPKKIGQQNPSPLTVF